MSDLSIIVNHLQSNVKKLIHLHTELQRENERLLKERNHLQRLQEQDAVKIKELEERNKIVKLARTIDNKENTSEIKHKINELVREIDKCVAILNR